MTHGDSAGLDVCLGETALGAGRACVPVELPSPGQVFRAEEVAAKMSRCTGQLGPVCVPHATPQGPLRQRHVSSWGPAMRAGGAGESHTARGRGTGWGGPLRALEPPALACGFCVGPGRWWCTPGFGRGNFLTRPLAFCRVSTREHSTSPDTRPGSISLTEWSSLGPRMRKAGSSPGPGRMTSMWADSSCLNPVTDGVACRKLLGLAKLFLT